MKTTKIFAILSGPSGVGKGPLQAAVRKLFPGMIDASPVLCTSRSPRKGEIHGEQYYFLPASFIQSLDKSADFAVSTVRSDWQAIHLPQVEDLLSKNNLVFAEVFHTFGPVLLQRASTRRFESVRIFLLPLPATASQDQIVTVMKEKLVRRATDSPEKTAERAKSAYIETQQAINYTHRLVNPCGEDDVDEWGEFGTRNGKHGTRLITNIHDLGRNARRVVEAFVKILQGELPPGDY